MLADVEAAEASSQGDDDIGDWGGEHGWLSMSSSSRQ